MSSSGRQSGTPRPVRSGGEERADRAQQFMPFAALRGYYDLVRQQEHVAQPRHELTEEEAAELSRVFSQVRRRQTISVTHYDGDSYVTTCGLVSNMDMGARTLTVLGARISLDDILSIDLEPPTSRS